MNKFNLIVKPSEDERYVLVSKELLYKLLRDEISLLSDTLLSENVDYEKCSPNCLNQGARGLLKWVEAFNLAAKPPKK